MNNVKDQTNTRSHRIGTLRSLASLELLERSPSLPAAGILVPLSTAVVVVVVVVGEDTVRILPFPPISNSSVIVFKAAIAVEHEQNGWSIGGEECWVAGVEWIRRRMFQGWEPEG